jgi:hypothetical protein
MYRCPRRRLATNIVGTSFVDLKITFVGYDTYRIDIVASPLEPNTIMLNATYGITSTADLGRSFRVFPLEIQTGNRKQKLNWNNVTAYGSSDKSGNELCAASSANSIITIPKKNINA